MLYDPAHGGRDVITALQQKRTSILDSLDNQRLTLFRQPIYGIASRKIEMYEVLVRIKEADGKIISPADFIAEAESLDLIQQIDERVIAAPLHHSKKLADTGLPTILTINVSSRSVGMQMAEDAISIGTELGVNLFDIIFEVTVTATQRSGGHAIGLDVIAEFVQDEETLKFLGEIGLKYAQGYYLGEPEPFPLGPE